MCCGTADLRGYRTRNSVQELGGREGSRSRTRPTRTSTAAGTARASGELTVRRIWREGTATGAQVRAREGCESRACSTNACRERRDEVRVGGQARRGERTSASTRATRKSLQRPAARQQTRADRDGESSLASGSASRGEGGAFAGPCLSHIRTRLHSAMGNDEAISYNTRLCDGAAIVPRGGLSWFYKKSIECTSFSSRFNSRAYSNTAGRVRRSISIPVPRV